jgi:hypothetical protein
MSFVLVGLGVALTSSSPREAHTVSINAERHSTMPGATGGTGRTGGPTAKTSYLEAVDLGCMAKTVDDIRDDHPRRVRVAREHCVVG